MTSNNSDSEARGAVVSEGVEFWSGFRARRRLHGSDATAPIPAGLSTIDIGCGAVAFRVCKSVWINISLVDKSG